MSERTILTVATGLIGASWVYYFALYLQPSSNLRWAAIPVGIALGALTWWRYSGGHRTETAFAEEVPKAFRIFIAVAMSLVGFIGGFIIPSDFGAKDASPAFEVALGFTLAGIWGWLAWSHPTLFYKNRRF